MFSVGVMGLSSRAGGAASGGAIGGMGGEAMMLTTRGVGAGVPGSAGCQVSSVLVMLRPHGVGGEWLVLAARLGPH
jgi:hypothetical protein